MAFRSVSTLPGRGCSYSKASRRIAFALALLFSCCFPLAAAALEHFVGDTPEVYFKDRILFLHLRVSVDDEDGLRLLLRDGAILELALKVTVERKRTLWANENIAAREFSSLLKYDPLTRKYLLTTPGTRATVQAANLRSLLAGTWKDLDLPLLEADKFVQGEDYRVDLGLSLQYTELPPWLDRSLVFWSREVVQPEPYKMEFRFDNAALSR
ncbi:MAG: DUF4390 domain-containing protein [Deltaproteobacteria bacterium]|nr:DUF4390 domain-containing protein [Deltaproteobacteria bacterium]